jgi:hypothetical protein
MDFAAGVYLSEAPSPPMTPYPPPYTLYSVYVYTVYLFTQGGRKGGDEPERRLEGQQFTKLGQKYQHD